jgi:hypothetical protein
MNPASIIPLSSAHTITTGFQGRRIYMENLRDEAGDCDAIIV